jgi:hypothetical protein
VTPAGHTAQQGVRQELAARIAAGRRKGDDVKSTSTVHDPALASQAVAAAAATTTTSANTSPHSR